MLVAGEPKHQLFQARFSPNGRWISFLAVTPRRARPSSVSSRAVRYGPRDRLDLRD